VNYFQALKAFSLGLGLYLSHACAAPKAEPGAVTVEYRLISTELRPLRYAVLWLQQSPKRMAIGPQGKVGEDHSFRIHFVRPELPFAKLTPIERLHLATQTRIGAGGLAQEEEVYADAYRPRIVVFVDDNENGRLDFEPDSLRVQDTVIALDGDYGSSIALLAEPRAALAKLTLESAAAFYATNPVFSDFVTTTGSDILTLASPSVLTLTSTEFATDPFAAGCGRRLATSTTDGETHVYVDARLPLRETCGLEAPNCSSLELAKRPPSGLDLDGSKSLQCKSNGAFAALTMQNLQVTCSDCVCSTTRELVAYVVAAADPPPWWPCGAQIPYCDAGRTFVYALDYQCIQARDSADAGTSSGPIAADAGVPTVSSRDAGR
jgi:hypothetical protein